MANPSIPSHTIWIEQCQATRRLRDHFGLDTAIAYLIGDKLFKFVTRSEEHTEHAGELPTFIARIQQIFTPAEIDVYLKTLKRMKRYAPPEERSRLSRIQNLLQP